MARQLRHLLALLPLSASLVMAPASAQEEPAPEEALPPPAPVFTFIGFQDLPPWEFNTAPDCEPLPTEPGGSWVRPCIERVRFVDPARVEYQLDAAPRKEGRPLQARRVARARWKNTSQLTLEAWEVMARRWYREGDILRQTLEPLGYTTMPNPALQWSRSKPVAPRNSGAAGTILALPNTESWLAPPRWVSDSPDTGSQDRSRSEVIFPDVRYRLFGEDGKAAPSETKIRAADFVRMDGRFAERLGADGKSHDFDVMDANRKDSKPFFEQIYPFTGPASRAPLQAFNTLPAAPREGEVQPPDPPIHLPYVFTSPWPEHDREKTPPKAADLPAWGEFVSQASRHWEDFYYTVAIDVSRFALEDFTENHMRVLTSLTTMRSPPAYLEDGSGRSRDLVAAASGQTDRKEDVEKKVDRKALAIAGGLALKYGKLPDRVVDDWLPLLIAGSEKGGYGPGETQKTRADLDEVAQGFFQEYLRSPGIEVRLPGTSVADMKTWMDENLQPGRDQERFAKDLRAAYLQILVERVQGLEQDEVETKVFLDHINLAILENLDPTKGVRTAPAPLVTSTLEQWTAVLGRHGYGTRLVNQGLGAVDPTAICTTKDGRDALEEPSFGATQIDVYVEGPEGLREPEDVIVQAWDRLPFLMVDDPSWSLHDKVMRSERVVGLPGGRAIYRVRWTVWTGWHLLWVPETQADGRVRLAARTAAVCDDMVLAPRSLIPTLVRGALLEGTFTSTEDFRRKDWREWTEGKEKGQRKRNESLDDADAAAANADKAAKAGKAGGEAGLGQLDAAKAADGGGRKAMAAEGAQGALDKLLSSEPKAFEGGGQWAASGPGAELKGVMRERLDELAARSNGLLLFIFDTSHTKRQRWLRDGRPRTPYSRIQRGVGGFRDVRTAGWAWFIPNPAAEAEAQMMFPAYREADTSSGDDAEFMLVNTTWSENKPGGWRRPSTLDWNIQMGFGGFPLRSVYYECIEEAYVPSSTTACQEVFNYQTPYSEKPVGYIGVQRSDGLSFDLGSNLAWWLDTRPAWAFEAGLQFRLDMITPGPALPDQWQNTGTDDQLVDFAWTFRPQGGLLIGARFAPSPAHLWRWGKRSHPWGVTHSGGQQALGRTQWGIRGSFLMGPGFNGLEGTLGTELWAGSSVRSSRSPHAPFTPYHPSLLVGPYAQGLFGFMMAPNTDVQRYLELRQSWALVLGVRAQLRLKGRGPAVPEAK